MDSETPPPPAPGVPDDPPPRGPRTRVFISHSSGGDPSLVKALHAALDGDTYEVLLDSEYLRTGTPWRECLHAMLAECDAAVILFSERALESEWVLKEATLLSWRAALDPKFKLLPILLPGVAPEYLGDPRFEPLALSDIQQAAAADADAVAEIVRREVTPRRLSTPFDVLCAKIADELGGVGDRMLELACDQHLEPVKWEPGHDRRQTFADRLSRKILAAEDDVLRTALVILDALDADPEVRTGIVELLAPLWVEPEAAGLLARTAARRLPSDTDLVLHGNYVLKFTAKMYMGRAYPLKKLPKLVTVEDSDVGDYAEHVAGRVRASVRAVVPHMAGEDDPSVDRLIRRSPDPFVVLLPRVPPDADTLDALRRLWPNATFIIPADEPVPEGEPLYPGVRRLHPELSLEREQEAYDAYCDAWYALS